MLKTLFGLACASAILAPSSGLEIGEGVSPFHPNHVTGPLKGTNGCPP